MTFPLPSVAHIQCHHGFLAFVIEPEFLDSGKKPEPYVGVAWLCSPLAGRWFQHWWALLYSKLTGTVTSLAKTEGCCHLQKKRHGQR